MGETTRRLRKLVEAASGEHLEGPAAACPRCQFADALGPATVTALLDVADAAEALLAHIGHPPTEEKRWIVLKGHGPAFHRDADALRAALRRLDAAGGG